jgi:hypothetical protein
MTKQEQREHQQLLAELAALKANNTALQSRVKAAEKTAEQQATVIAEHEAARERMMETVDEAIQRRDEALGDEAKCRTKIRALDAEVTKLKGENAELRKARGAEQ